MKAGEIVIEIYPGEILILKFSDMYKQKIFYSNKDSCYESHIDYSAN